MELVLAIVFFILSPLCLWQWYELKSVRIHNEDLINLWKKSKEEANSAHAALYKLEAKIEEDVRAAATPKPRLVKKKRR